MRHLSLFRDPQQLPGPGNDLNMDGQDTDVLQPDPVRPGGLVQKKVGPVLSSNSIMLNTRQQHKLDPLPVESRVSTLGLDRLAMDKRAASSQGDRDGKRQRLSQFKSM